MKNKVDVAHIVADLKHAFDALRAEITDDFTSPLSERAEHALAHLETYAAITVRVLRQTNPSKIRDAARAEEIAAYVHGREVLHG